MIVTLVHEIPGDCAEYFPTSVGTSLTYGEMEVSLVSEEQTREFVLRRNFQVKVSGEALVRPVTHYWFQGWEDWQLPTGASRSALAILVEEAADYVSGNAVKTGE